MLLVDTEKDNEAALDLFRSLGFGNASEHVYLTLNLTNEADYLRHKERKQ
jgi:ribosomal protein S18 acetylase RimI-like enzyme